MEVIILDPNVPIPPAQPILSSVPTDNFFLYPAVFLAVNEENDYLASLDSDTREYVLRHTDENRTRADVIECINKLTGQAKR